MTDAEGEQLVQALAQLPPMVGTASSDDGSVVVEAAAGGQLRAVRLTQRALTRGAAYLSQTVISVAAQATARANRQAQINYAKVLGDKMAKHFDALGLGYDPKLTETEHESENPLGWRQ